MTAAEALRAAIPRLAAAGVFEPAKDARQLLAHAMDVKADRLTLHLADEVSSVGLARFERDLAVRIARQPVSQIIGHRQFWGLDFRVTPDVLDPRPETECLVAAALDQPFKRVLDLGTGSGCILLSVLANQPMATGQGVDLSDAALSVAMQNARDLGLLSRAEFLNSDWFSNVTGCFDLILSNPPYIAEDELSELSQEVRQWEPKIALTPGGDGLAAYRRIAKGASAHLFPGGRLMVEIGPTQARDVVAMFQDAGFVDCHVLQDMDGRDRVVVASKPLSNGTQ
jgi:release factor glutamine methyltransferase